MKLIIEIESETFNKVFHGGLFEKDNKLIESVTEAFQNVTIIPNYGGQVVPDTLQGWRYEERPHGKWEYNQYDGNPNIGNWHCSECRHLISGKYNQYPNYIFCPYCGAKMKGGAE